MNLPELVSQLVIDTHGGAGGWLQPTSDSSIGAFLPELTLCATIVLMLMLRIPNWGRRIDTFWIVLLGTGTALYISAPWHHLTLGAVDVNDPSSVMRMEIFTGMLVYDPFTVFIRSVLISFAFLFAIFTRLSGIPDREEAPDIYSLVLGATLGMCLMASANHLLMVFMAVEMASLPSYALAGMLKGRRESSEAALKYSIYGAGASGVMLYGISLVAGLLNTAHLPTLAVELAKKLPGMPAEEYMVLALAALMIMVGLAFKLSAVPFHFWCPDVFEGAAAEVNAFLSVASKAAALALLVRVTVGFGSIPPEGVQPGARTLAILSANEAGQSETAQRENSELEISQLDVSRLDITPPKGLFAVPDQPPSTTGSLDNRLAQNHAVQQSLPASPIVLNRVELMASLQPAREFMGKLIAFLAAITCTFGNLAAYGQTNIKRLLAYSTIAHAGYMMMPVSAMMVLAGRDPAGAEQALGALAIYIAIYSFMNLGAFAVVAFMRNAMRSEQISDYAGLIRKCPMTAICFSLILFGLIGLPPLSGFIGKFAVFGALMDAYQTGGQSATYLLVLLIIGGLNTAVSLFYYLRIVKVMTMDPEPENRPPFAFPEVSLQGAFICLVSLPTMLLMLNWERLRTACLAAAQYMFPV